MRTICLYFEIHQIIHLKRYRFFDIGTNHYYYDDYANETSINEVAERSYIPALNTLIGMVKDSGGAFKVALSISGVALEQLEIHAPAVIDLLHQLNDTGCCEFLAEPYSHGLSSLANEDCFKEEVLRQSAKMKQMFGKAPKVFRNSSLIYNDEIGAMVASMGFKGMLTEGAKHVLGWKSPHYVYHCNMNPNLKLLLRDFKLSDDISLRFSNSEWNEYPLFADKYISWIDAFPQEEQVINIFMELCSLGMSQPLSSNILEFLKALPAISQRYPLPKVMNALKGNFFLVTGTNRRMRYVASHPMENMAMIRISDTGDWYEIIADNPVRPTSELPSHLSMHDYLKGRGVDNKVVLHTHPTDLVAMTHNRVFLQSDVLGKLLWSMIPETRVIVPKGLGIVPYKLPGSLELADATIRLLDRYDVVMWEKHGALAVGGDVIECFDMIDTLSKSAQIYLQARAMGFEPEGLTDEQSEELRKAFRLV